MFREVNILSLYLQKSNLDYCRAKELAASTVNLLKKSRNSKQAELYDTDTALKCERLGIEQPVLPRIRKLARKLMGAYFRFYSK